MTAPISTDSVRVRTTGAGSDPGGEWLFRACVGWLVLITTLVIFYPWLPFVDDPTGIGDSTPNVGPTMDHWFGTSRLGVDVFAQVLDGGRISLRIAAIGTAVGLGVGGALGVCAGYFRGWVDMVVGFLVNAMLSIPALVLVTFIVAVRGQSLFQVTLAICILAIPALARIVRASTLQVAEREYVQAARVVGARDRSILLREVLPNVMPALISFAFLTTGIILVAESSLSYLGLSVQQPAITWGSIISEGRIDMRQTPHMVFLPALVLFATVLSLNFIGDHLLKRFDIRGSAL